MAPLLQAFNAGSERWIAFGTAMCLQSCLLFALLLALDMVLRRRVRAALRHAFWLLFLVKLLLPPSWSFPTGAGYWLARQTSALPPAASAPASQHAKVEFTSSARSPSARTDAISPPPRLRSSLRPAGWLVLAWVIGAVGLLGCFVRRLIQLRRIIARSVPAPESVLLLLERCRQQLGLRGLVHIRLSNDVRSPALCGWRHPVVLLPSPLVEEPGLSPAEGPALSSAEGRLRAVLLHELIHLQRGDLWIQSLQALLQVAYWWHPLVWAANLRIRLVREEAVDDRVMRELGADAEVYPSTLLGLAKAALPLRFAGLSLLGILDSGGGLSRRVRRLLEGAPPAQPRLGWSGLAWTFLLGALVVPMRGQVRPLPTLLAGPNLAVTRSLEAMDTAILDRLPPQAVLQPSGFADRSAVVGGWMSSGRRIMGRKQSARELLAIAYGSRPSRVTPSAGLPEGTFDFIVTVPEQPIEVLRGLLRDQLGLSARRTPARMNALVLALQEPKAALQASALAPQEASVVYDQDRVIFKAATFGTLASFLEHYLDVPVVDETQSTQPYDFVLPWVSSTTPAARAALKRAVQDQLGLTLTQAQRETDAILVESRGAQKERAAADAAPTVVAAVYDALYDPQRGSHQPKPVLGQAQVQAVVGPAEANKSLTLDQAVKILRAAGYVPGSIIGLDEWFVENYGKNGALMIENASLVIDGRSDSLQGVVDFYEPPAVDRARRDELNLPLTRERERLNELLKHFTSASSIVVEQRQRVAELEARFRSRAFRVDPDLFLRNLQLRRGETIRAASDDPMEIFSDLLKGAGVDCTPPYLPFFNRETGTVLVWNTSEGLVAAERVILGLNQRDGRPSSYAPPAGTNPSILAEATCLQSTDAAFTLLGLGPSPQVAQQIGEFWHLDPQDWNTVKTRVRNAGMATLSRPRVQSSPGVTSRLFVGGSQASVSLESVPYLSGGQLEMTVLVQTTGYFAPDQPAEWPDAGGWTNVALHGRVTLTEGGGVVLRARHSGTNPTNNLVVLLSGRVLP